MQITIVQSEIEKAIIDYIKSQVSVRDDMEIDIDLRATRGAEGFQAIIDIHPKRSGGSSKTSTPKGGGGSSSKSSNDKPLKIAETVAGAKSSGRGSSKSTPSKAQDNETPTAVNDAAKVEPETQVEGQPDPEASYAPAVVEAAAEPQAEPEVAETPKKTLSLFAQKKAEPAVEAEVEAEAASDQPAGEVKSIFGGLKRPVNA